MLATTLSLRHWFFLYVATMSEILRFSFLHTSTLPFLVTSLKRKFTRKQASSSGQFTMFLKLFFYFLRRTFIQPLNGWGFPLVQVKKTAFSQTEYWVDALELRHILTDARFLWHSQVTQRGRELFLTRLFHCLKAKSLWQSLSKLSSPRVTWRILYK